MTLESAKKYLDDLKAGKVDFDPLKIDDVSNHDAAMKHIHSMGYDFTPEELLQASEESNFHGKKITMSGEEAVAGGSASDWLRGGAVAVSAAGAAACA